MVGQIVSNQPKSSILLIDDNLEDLRILVAMLKSSGHSLVISNNGPDGLTRAALLKPNLILLDINMPKMDGFAVLRLLKGDERTLHIPVIFLTAANDAVSRIDGFKIGAVDYIVKPPFVEEVLLRVAVHLKKTMRDMFDTETEISDDGDYSPTESPLKNSDVTNSDTAVKVACNLIARDLRRNWSIDNIASKVGLSRKKLTSTFKEKFGITVIAWVREQRLQKASEWLIKSNLSIQGISDDLGFDSPGNFSTAFKDRFGVSPRVYRQQLSVSDIETKY